MDGKRAGTLVLGLISCFLLFPVGVVAQSSIAGRVTGTTGGTLPGVTIEAASQALIEQVRVVVTDEGGRYRIVELRPGIYTVTFSLSGFSSLIREGIKLPANFTASVDAELAVGGIEKSIVVSGESSVVDVQSATRQQVMTRELIESVPTGRSLWSIGQMVPGVAMSKPDVGGNQTTQQAYMSIHGSSTADNTLQVDGMNMKSLEANGNLNHYHNVMMFEEVNYETAGSTAAIQGAGVRLNMIPKNGGNRFAGQVIASYLPGTWGSDNATQDLRARGLKAGGGFDNVHDFNVGFGGPIVRNRLWFFSSGRRWGNDQFLDNSFFNLTPQGPSGRKTYDPDYSRQIVDNNLLKSGMVRLTAQIDQRHKFAAYLERTSKFRGHECGLRMAEEACGVRIPRLSYMAQVKYTGTINSRLLIEGGLAVNRFTWSYDDPQSDNLPTAIPRQDRTLGTSWSARPAEAQFRSGSRHVLGGAVSYVTGSHHFKTGVTFDFGAVDKHRSLQKIGVVDLIQEYRLGVPSTVLVYNTPLHQRDKLNGELAFYVQDSWTFDRLTINPGLRFEWLHASTPEQAVGAGRFIPERRFNEIDDRPNWRDWSPRLAVAYDLFGDAKTAIKGSMGRYVMSYSVGFSETYNPMRLQRDRRTWDDLNGDDIAQDNEIGPINTPFDVIGLVTRRPDENIERPYQWEYTLGAQREVVPGVSMSFNVTHRNWNRLFWTDNVLIDHSDYTTIPIQNPRDPSETIMVFNLDPAKRGLVDDVDKNSNVNDRRATGIDLGLSASLPGGRGKLFGGWSATRVLSNQCEWEGPNGEIGIGGGGTSVNGGRFCDQGAYGMPFQAITKLSGNYALPYGIEVAGSIRSYAGGMNELSTSSQYGGGSSLNEVYQVTRNLIPGLTQSLILMPLIQPGTKHLPRLNQADFRIGKIVQMGQVRLRQQFNIWNVLNSASILQQHQVFGAALDRIDQILPPRVYSFSVQADF